MATAIDPGLAEQPGAFLPRLARVARKRRECPDTFTLEAVSAGGRPEFQFEPGQFFMVGLPGIGEVPISVSGDPAMPSVLTHTLREVGAVTRALASLRVDDPFMVRGPYGTAWPVREAVGKDLILVAGGIGLAPLRPVIYHVMAHRALYNRFGVLYGTRTPDDVLYRDQLHKWRSSFDMDLAITVDRSTAHWRGNVGVVTKLIPRAPFDPTATIAMICGPEVMMRFTVLELMHRGVPASSIYVSLERNMKCGIGLCGHCQIRGEFTCRTGPVYRYDAIADLMEVEEL